MHDDLNKIRREQMRWRVLFVLDTARPDRVGEPLLLGALQAAGFDVTAKDLARELDYLKDRKLVLRDDRTRWGLTFIGTDVVEFTVPCQPGIACPQPPLDRAVAIRRERMRLRILAILDTSRPVSMSESFLADVLLGAGYSATPTELRRELDYLQARDLVHTERGHEWLCEVTHYGTDLVEGNREPFPGIAKPPR